MMFLAMAGPSKNKISSGHNNPYPHLPIDPQILEIHHQMIEVKPGASALKRTGNSPPKDRTTYARPTKTPRTVIPHIEPGSSSGGGRGNPNPYQPEDQYSARDEDEEDEEDEDEEEPLDKIMKSVEQGEDGEFLCPKIDNCHKGYKYKANLRAHLRSVHEVPAVKAKTMGEKLLAQGEKNEYMENRRKEMKPTIDALMKQVEENVKNGGLLICPLGGCKDPRKAWKRIGDLRIHVMAHYGIQKPLNQSKTFYICACGKEILFHQLYKDHVKSCGQAKPYEPESDEREKEGKGKEKGKGKGKAKR